MGVTIAMVAHPVCHAISHGHSDSHDETGGIFFTDWGEQDLCPYCDAISPFAEPLPTRISFEFPGIHEDVGFSVVLYVDLRSCLFPQMRAPPFLA